jgi:putative membrane protein
MQNPIQTRSLQSLVLVVLAALALAILAGMALTHAAIPETTMWGWHGGAWNDGHMTGWGWGMVLFGLLWMALLVGLPVYLGYRLLARSRTSDRTQDSALAVLEERYARGEIDDEEFERRRERLTSDDSRH